MSYLTITGSGAALLLASVAAMYDCRSGTIPNWLTLPPLAAAPLAYGVFFSPELAAQSLVGALLSGFGPYWAFRLGGMGGGDVKLFAALGSVIGFDPLAGLEIQLTAFVFALLCALAVLTCRGKLLGALGSVLSKGMHRIAPARFGVVSKDDVCAPMRMGWAVCAATATYVIPHLVFGGTGS